MSANNGGWKPRKVEQITCPSGEMVHVKRPGPEFMLKAGRVARTFTKQKEEIPNDQNIREYGLDLLANMSDEELAKVMIFGRELVCAMLVSPKLVQNPQPDSDEIGPSDIPFEDFCFLFNHGMTDYFGIKIPVGDTEVEVKDLESFRAESGVRGDGVDSVLLPSDVEQPDGDRGLVGSAGA